MNFLSLTHNRLLILLMIGLNVLAACDPSQTGLLRDPGGVASDSAPYAQKQSISTLAVPSRLGSQILSSYSGSYALLIGESQYTNGWGNLGSIPGELRQVEQTLKSQGFTVEKSFNLNSQQLINRFKKFVDDYGFDKNNRLLFFYSGHGHTREDKGYIVPVDAANPNIDERAFLRKAVGMNQVLTWARRIEAKHVLFLFDSCFSGTVFKAKSLPKIPRQISQAAKEPVRQFITAGDAGETVPAKSVFAPAFVDALRYGWGDLFKDGYVTGEELGLYLKNKVPQHTEQTPQYGKIRDYELSRGDFVFVVAGGNQDVAQLSTPAPVAPVPAPIPVKPPPIVKLDSDRDGITDDQDKCPRNTIVEISKGVYKRGSRKGCPIDSDNDRVPDYRDSCPRNSSKEISQSVDSNGCPKDSDQDNVPDYRDSCPRNASKEISQGVGSNGCPLDSDRDGVFDYRDNCPHNHSKEISQGVDSNGCPKDQDRDGVFDYRDNCPHNNSKEISQGVDSRGCPKDSDRDGVANYQDSCPRTSFGVKVKENGCPIPVPVVSTHSSYRYTDNGDGTVTDNRSGLIWLKNANCFGEQDWETAMQSATNLASGQCGLRDGSRRNIWRLPTKKEWEAMMDEKYAGNWNQPVLSNAAGTGLWKEGDAFLGVQAYSYWSSTTVAGGTSYAWYVNLDDDLVGFGNKTSTDYVWPVRGGQ